MYIINQHSKKPLHLQLYEALKKDIMKNYAVGEKLPSIRKIASLYNLSKNTVETAYGQLYAEGYIESYPKRGYFVSDIYFDSFQTKQNLKTTPQTKEITYKYDFFPAKLSKDSFPLKTWKRLFTKAIDDTLDFGSYPDGQGELGLREEIAKYLIASRGVVCEASQIIICGGFSDAMGLLAKLVKHKYNHFAIENPGYHIARKIFASYGYHIDKIGINTKGLDIQALQQSKANIVYITPSHQYPTGVTMPISNRVKLLHHINQKDGLIIEDDYDSELAYTNRPIPSLQGLDKYDRVVYLGTFAKSLSPALRIAYMVLPQHLMPLYQESYDAHFPRVSLTTQKTLELFISHGYWDKHVRKIRTLNKKKHDLMRNLLQKKLANTMTILAQGGGLAILIYPTVPFDWEKFKKSAQDAKIKLYFAKERCGGDFEAIRMGFGGFSEQEIHQAIDAFSVVWYGAIVMKS